jgi:hypothetical protein
MVPENNYTITAPLISEVNCFLSLGINEKQTAMDFWIHRVIDFPILSQMAKIHLAVSPGSVPVESMFTAVGYIRVMLFLKPPYSLSHVMMNVKSCSMMNLFGQRELNYVTGFFIHRHGQDRYL